MASSHSKLPVQHPRAVNNKAASSSRVRNSPNKDNNSRRSRLGMSRHREVVGTRKVR
jgi:hypothetical protein